MTILAVNRTSRQPLEPTFLNIRAQVVRPVCFAMVYWDGPGDTLYAFEDREAFERQRASAERNFVHVQVLSENEAISWISGGGKAVLHDMSVGSAAAFGNLRLVFR